MQSITTFRYTSSFCPSSQPYLVSTRVEAVLHEDAVRVVQHLQNRQFSVLVFLVLEHLLYRHQFLRFYAQRLQNHTESPRIDYSLDLERLVMLKSGQVCTLPSLLGLFLPRRSRLLPPLSAVSASLLLRTKACLSNRWDLSSPS